LFLCLTDKKMADPNKFNIESWEQWFTLKISEKKDKELADVLSGQHISRIQKWKLAKKKEQFEKLRPIGFDDAPDSAKEKWEEYIDTDNLEQLQWMHDNVSWNADHTMNIIKLKKTFCEDVSWIDQKCDWEDAKALAKSKWYTLPTDYNDSDSDEVKQNSDWYTVINIFSNGNWDTIEGMKLFRDMAWCNNRYWTATEEKNDKWEEFKDFVRSRNLYDIICYRHWMNFYFHARVCGFKDSM